MKKECCVFCRWTPVTINKIPNELKYRIIDIENEYFAVLDKAPKIAGHALVIAQDHYDDILDDRLFNSANMSKINVDVFKGVLKVARWLKRRLGASKVYIVTICEHWEGKNGTEHLHYHLIPQYKEQPIENRDIAAESLIAREGVSIKRKWFKETLRHIANEINPTLKKVRDQATLDT